MDAQTWLPQVSAAEQKQITHKNFNISIIYNWSFQTGSEPIHQKPTRTVNRLIPCMNFELLLTRNRPCLSVLRIPSSGKKSLSQLKETDLSQDFQLFQPTPPTVLLVGCVYRCSFSCRHSSCCLSQAH